MPQHLFPDLIKQFIQRHSSIVKFFIFNITKRRNGRTKRAQHFRKLCNVLFQNHFLECNFFTYRDTHNLTSVHTGIPTKDVTIMTT